MEVNYEQDIKELGFVLKKSYAEPKKEKYLIPGKTIKKQKTVIVTELVTKEVETTEKNMVPGIIVSIASAIIAVVVYRFGNSITPIFIAGIGITVGVILIFTLKKKIKNMITEEFEVEKTIEEDVKLPDEYGIREIPNKYRIKSIGKTAINFSISSSNGNKLLLCEDDGAPLVKHALPGIHKMKKFKKDVAKMEDRMNNIPYILEGDVEVKDITEETTYGQTVKLRGLEKDLSNFFNYVEETYQNIKHIPVNLPIIQDESLTQFFQKSEKDTNDGYADEFTALMNSDEGYDFEDYTKNLLLFWSEHIRLLNTIRINSLKNEISPEFYNLGQISQYTSFNFYCPDCNKELQDDILNRDYSVQNDSSDEEVYFSKNTRCKYNPIENLWVCPVCENSYVQPIPIHKTMDEVLLPVYDSLMEEHKVEREKHHSEMRKKEIEFRNEMKKEIERIIYDNTTDMMKLEEDMNRLCAEVDGESDAIKYMQKVATQYKEIQSSVIDNIIQENINVNREISEKTVRVLEELDSFKNEKMAVYEQKMKGLSKAKRVEDERRHSEYISTINNGFDRTVAAQQETRASINENTEATREGFNQTVAAQQETRASINENTEAAREGFKESHKLQTRNNAVQIAMAKKQGVNLRDHAWTRLDKHAKYFVDDMVSLVSGHDSIEAEVQKEN